MLMFNVENARACPWRTSRRAPLCARLRSGSHHQQLPTPPPPSRGQLFPVKLTGHVDVLLAGEPDARVELPHHVLVLPGLPDVLHRPRVVDAGAVVPDAERLLGGCRPGAERLHHFPRPLAPVAGGQGRHGEEQGDKVQGESQRCSPPPVYPHDGDRRSEDAELNPSARVTPDCGDFSCSDPHNPVIPVNISAANYRGASGSSGAPLTSAAPVPPTLSYCGLPPLHDHLIPPPSLSQHTHTLTHSLLSLSLMALLLKTTFLTVVSIFSVIFFMWNDAEDISSRLPMTLILKISLFVF